MRCSFGHSTTQNLAVPKAYESTEWDHIEKNSTLKDELCGRDLEQHLSLMALEPIRNYMSDVFLPEARPNRRVADVGCRFGRTAPLEPYTLNPRKPNCKPRNPKPWCQNLEPGTLAS
jgi:hypothetical protein